MATTHPAPSRLSAAGQELLRRIESRTARVAIIGMGYVGLPLAGAMRRAGYPVLGFDIDPVKVAALRRGEAYIHHLGEAFFKDLARDERFAATTDPADLASVDAILICVPTPLGQHREPDLSAVLGSTRAIAPHLRKGQLVVLESTTYPGTTRLEVKPILDAAGLACGEDYFLAFSPEREDPGSIGRSAASIPKLVGGIDEPSGHIAQALYAPAVASAILVSSAEVAESAKLLENIYRCVNIALVNEMKVVLDKLGIDVWEVIDAASTKPFGFQPFYPGPGLGGHCIPIDPFYLTWRARAVGCPTRFIELAGEVNGAMPHHVLHRVQEALNQERKSIAGSRVLVLGIAYKKNIDDPRESPAAEILDLLAEAGADCSYHDPHLPRFPRMRAHSIDLASVPLTPETLRAADCVLVVTDHDAVDYGLVAEHARLVVDTRNALARVNPARVRARVVKA